MIDVPAAWVNDTKAVCPYQRAGGSYMATGSRRVGPPAAITSGVPPPASWVPLSPSREGRKVSNLPGSNP